MGRPVTRDAVLAASLACLLLAPGPLLAQDADEALSPTQSWITGIEAPANDGPNSWVEGIRAPGAAEADTGADAPDDLDSPVAAFRLRRKSRAHADLLIVRTGDHLDARMRPNTICYAVAEHGIRLDE